MTGIRWIISASEWLFLNEKRLSWLFRISQKMLNYLSTQSVFLFHNKFLLACIHSSLAIFFNYFFFQDLKLMLNLLVCILKNIKPCLDSKALFIQLEYFIVLSMWKNFSDQKVHRFVYFERIFHFRVKILHHRNLFSRKECLYGGISIFFSQKDQSNTWHLKHGLLYNGHQINSCSLWQK